VGTAGSADAGIVIDGSGLIAAFPFACATEGRRVLKAVLARLVSVSTLGQIVQTSAGEERRGPGWWWP
jgi:hypothetical protein